MFKLPNFFLAIKNWFQKEKSELQEYVDFLVGQITSKSLEIKSLQDTNAELNFRILRLNDECYRHKKDKLELYRKLGHAQDEIICLKHEFQLLKDKANKQDVFAQIIGTVKKLGL